MYRYKKADLERIVLMQLENLDAMNDLLRIMKVQNELLEKANEKLAKDVAKFKRKDYDMAAMKRAALGKVQL